MRLANLASALVFFVVSVFFTTQAAAAFCEINSVCAFDAQCTETKLSLEWKNDIPAEVLLDGISYDVQRITKDTVKDTVRTANGTTWRIVVKGPALLIKEPGYFGSISPTNNSGEISLSIVEAPNQYVTYAEALALRRTYNGICEGLF